MILWCQGQDGMRRSNRRDNDNERLEDHAPATDGDLLDRWFGQEWDFLFLAAHKLTATDREAQERRTRWSRERQAYHGSYALRRDGFTRRVLMASGAPNATAYVDGEEHIYPLSDM